MPKTVSQADKKALKAQKLAEQAEQRIIEKAERDAVLKKQKDAELTVLTKKDKKSKEILRSTTATETEADTETEVDEKAHVASRSASVTTEVEYIDELRPFIAKLSKQLIGCTFTPGQISKVENSVDAFDLSFQREDKNNYIFKASNGNREQEVLIVVKMIKNINAFPAKNVQEIIIKIIAENSVAAKKASASVDTSAGNSNRTSGLAEQGLWKASHKQAHLAELGRTKTAAEEEKIAERRRKLANKNIAADQVDAYAKRDQDIVDGKARTKNSMRKH
jgi:hypothetical protein